jgi:hypothetical protein
MLLHNSVFSVNTGTKRKEPTPNTFGTEFFEVPIGTEFFRNRISQRNRTDRFGSTECPGWSTRHNLATFVCLCSSYLNHYMYQRDELLVHRRTTNTTTPKCRAPHTILQTGCRVRYSGDPNLYKFVSRVLALTFEFLVSRPPLHNLLPRVPLWLVCRDKTPTYG